MQESEPLLHQIVAILHHHSLPYCTTTHCHIAPPLIAILHHHSLPSWHKTFYIVYCLITSYSIWKCVQCYITTIVERLRSNNIHRRWHIYTRQHITLRKCFASDIHHRIWDVSKNYVAVRKQRTTNL